MYKFLKEKLFYVIYLNYFILSQKFFLLKNIYNNFVFFVTHKI